MQKVSTEWKSNQAKTLVGESYVEVSLDIADPDALADATSRDNGATYLSKTSQVVSEVDKNIAPYSTLEQNLWILDGSRKAIPTSDYGDSGFIGEALSDNACGYVDKTPVVTVEFSRVHSKLIPAVTITWGKCYGEYAQDFIVTAYNDDVEVAKREVIGNKEVKSVAMMDIINYNRITITILRWCLPRRRARIEEIFVGMNKVYDKKMLFKFSHKQTVDPLSTSLPKSEISFGVDNSDNSYNPYNPASLSKYLMERQEVKTRYGYKLDNGIEWIKGGTFYLSEWNAEQNSITADFVARDLLEFMSETHYEGLYSPDGVSLYNLALRLLQQANLPLNSDGSIKWVLDESLKDIYTVAPLPIDSIANNLQLIANAGGCVFYQDRNGTLRIEKINTEMSDYEITFENSYSKSEITLSKPLKHVAVKTYQYFEGDAIELYKGDMTLSGTNEIWVTYSNRAVNVSTTVTNGTLDSAEYYTNACKLTITAEGTVSILITGTELQESIVDVITNNEASGEIVSLENPLITDRERALVIGGWLTQYLKNRITLKSNWRADPRLDALDMVTNKNEYNANNVLITNIDYSYSGAFRGNAEGRVI